MAKYVIYGRPGCPWCDKAKAFLNERNVGYLYKNVRESDIAMTEFREFFPEAKTVPQIVYYRTTEELVKIGGYTALVDWYEGNIGEGSMI